MMSILRQVTLLEWLGAIVLALTLAELYPVLP